MEFFTHIAFFAAAQGLFLSLALMLVRRGNQRANGLLAIFIALYAVWIAEFAAYFTEYLYRVPHLLFASVGLPLLFGPLLLFYAWSLKGKQAFSRPVNWLHFLPFVLHTLYYVPFYVQSATTKLHTLRQLQNMESPPEFSLSFFLNEGLKSLHVMVYLGLLYKLYSRRKHAHRKAAPLVALHNHWLLCLIWGLGLFAVFDISHLLSIYLFQYDYLFMIAKGVLLSGALLVYFIGYSSLKRPEIIAGELNLKQSDTGSRYAKSSLTREKAERSLEILLHKMETDKPYLESGLNLKQLADSISISRHHLSQILNEQLHKSFADFINEYRIRAARKMLCDKAYVHYSILGIAYEAGFNNKASFNTAFKKHTGMTPSAYRKKFSTLNQ